LTPREELVDRTKINPIFLCNIDMINFLNARKGKILDIGCGANFFKKYNTVGIDNHPKAHIKQNISRMNHQEIIKKFGKFNKLLCINSLHFSNTINQIEKLKKLANNNARFVITANYKTLLRNNINVKEFIKKVKTLGKILKFIDTRSIKWIKQQKKKIKPHSVWYHDKDFFETRINEICKFNDYMNGNLRFYGEISC